MSWSIEADPSSRKRKLKRKRSVVEDVPKDRHNTAESGMPLTVSANVLMRDKFDWDNSLATAFHMPNADMCSVELADDILTISSSKTSTPIVIDLCEVKCVEFVKKSNRHLIRTDDDEYYVIDVVNSDSLFKLKKALEPYELAESHSATGTRKASMPPKTKKARKHSIVDCPVENAEMNFQRMTDTDLTTGTMEFQKDGESMISGFTEFKDFPQVSQKMTTIAAEDLPQFRHNAKLLQRDLAPIPKRTMSFLDKAIAVGTKGGTLNGDTLNGDTLDGDTLNGDGAILTLGSDCNKSETSGESVEIVKDKRSSDSEEKTESLKMATPFVSIKLNNGETVKTPEGYEALRKRQWERYRTNEDDSIVMKQLMEIPEGITCSHFLDTKLALELEKGQHANLKPNWMVEKLKADEANMCAPLCEKKDIDKLLPTDKLRVMFEIVSMFVFGYNFSHMLVLFGLHTHFNQTRAQCTSVYGDARTIGCRPWRAMYDWVLANFTCPCVEMPNLTIAQFRQKKVGDFVDGCKNEEMTLSTAVLWKTLSQTDAVLFIQTLFPFELLAKHLIGAGVDTMFVYLLALICTLQCPLYTWIFLCDEHMAEDLRVIGRFFDAMAKNSALRLVFKATPSAAVRCMWYFYMLCASDDFTFETLLETLALLRANCKFGGILGEKRAVIGAFECFLGHFNAESSLDSLTLTCLPHSVAKGPVPEPTFKGSGQPINRGCIFDVGVCECQLRNTEDVQLHNHERSGQSALVFNCSVGQKETECRRCDFAIHTMGRVMNADSEALTDMQSAADGITLPKQLDLEIRDRLVHKTLTFWFGLKCAMCFFTCFAHVNDFCVFKGFKGQKCGSSKRERFGVFSVVFGRHAFGLFPLGFLKGKWTLTITWQWKVGSWFVDFLLHYECSDGRTFEIWVEYFGSLHKTPKEDCSRALAIAEDFLDKGKKSMLIVLHANLLGEKEGVSCVQTMSQRQLVTRLALTIQSATMEFALNSSDAQITSIGCPSERNNTGNLEKTLRLRKVETPLHNVLVTNKKFGFKGMGFPSTPFPLASVDMKDTILFCPVPECNEKQENGQRLRTHSIDGHCADSKRAGSKCSQPEGYNLLQSRTHGIVTYTDDLAACERPTELEEESTD